jgi:hypothetical protein
MGLYQGFISKSLLDFIYLDGSMKCSIFLCGLGINSSSGEYIKCVLKLQLLPECLSAASRMLASAKYGKDSIHEAEVEMAFFREPFA